MSMMRLYGKEVFSSDGYYIQFYILNSNKILHFYPGVAFIIPKRFVFMFPCSETKNPGFSEFGLMVLTLLID